MRRDLGLLLANSFCSGAGGADGRSGPGQSCGPRLLIHSPAACLTLVRGCIRPYGALREIVLLKRLFKLLKMFETAVRLV